MHRISPKPLAANDPSIGRLDAPRISAISAYCIGLLQCDEPARATAALGSTRDLKEALNEIQIWSASLSEADARSKTEYQGGRRAMMATYQRRFTLLWNRPKSHTGRCASPALGTSSRSGFALRIGEKAVMEKFAMPICPQVIRHRPEFQTAAEKGKAAASEIRALWDFVDKRTRAPTADAKPKRKTREAKP